MVALLCTGTRLTTGYRYTTLLDATSTQEDNGVELISLAVVPDHDLTENGIGDRGNCFMRDIDTHRCCHMMLDIPNGHSAGI